MSKLEQSQLQAGGFVRLKAKVDQSVTEEVVARRYGSPALGDRVVVRLSADRLGPAEDLAMEYLGLDPSGSEQAAGPADAAGAGLCQLGTDASSRARQVCAEFW